MSKADINIWWDLESIKFENSFDPLWSFQAIRSSLDRLGLVGTIVSVKAYAAEGLFSKDIIKRLTASGVDFISVPVPKHLEERENSQLADSKPSTDLTKWVKENKPPSVIVLMSCDKGYLNSLQYLKASGYETCTIYATGTCTSIDVESANMLKLKWVEEVLERANPVDPKEHMLPYYGRDANFKVSTPLVAIHPLEHSVAVALGWDLRVYNKVSSSLICLQPLEHSVSLMDFFLSSDRSPVTLLDKSAAPCCNKSIRCIRYGATGKLFVSEGDEKSVKIWCTKFWNCLHIICSKKGVTSVAITSDDSHRCYADSIGDVYLVELDGIKEKPDKLIQTLLLIGSRIITSLVR